MFCSEVGYLVRLVTSEGYTVDPADNHGVLQLKTFEYRVGEEITVSLDLF